MPTTSHWIKDHEFRTDFPQGESLTLASVPGDQRPGPGPSPVEAVQAALASCTGIDVVHILQKQRKTLESLKIEVHPTRRIEYPQIYTDLELVYHLEGPDLDVNSVQRAVNLSHDKYCSVSGMLEPPVNITYRIMINGEPAEVSAHE